MKIGSLWFDNSKDSLHIKLKRAVEFYEKKYGQKPNAVYVNPKEDVTGLPLEGITVRTNRSVLPNHYWIGLDG